MRKVSEGEWVKNRVAEQWRDVEGVGETANFKSLCGRGDRGRGKCRGRRGDTGLVESSRASRVVRKQCSTLEEMGGRCENLYSLDSHQDTGGHASP